MTITDEKLREALDCLKSPTVAAMKAKAKAFENKYKASVADIIEVAMVELEKLRSAQDTAARCGNAQPESKPDNGISGAAVHMTEAELELEAHELSYLTRDFKCVVGIDDAINLAKKYRGM